MRRNLRCAMRIETVWSGAVFATGGVFAFAGAELSTGAVVFLLLIQT